MLRRQIMKLGKISGRDMFGNYARFGLVAEQLQTGYWKTDYRKVYFVSDKFEDLIKLHLGYQYYDDYFGNQINKKK